MVNSVVIDDHPEWAIAPIKLSRLVELSVSTTSGVVGLRLRGRSSSLSAGNVSAIKVNMPSRAPGWRVFPG